VAGVFAVMGWVRVVATARWVYGHLFTGLSHMWLPSSSRTCWTSCHVAEPTTLPVLRTCCGLFVRQETHCRVIDPADRLWRRETGERVVPTRSPLWWPVGLNVQCGSKRSCYRCAGSGTSDREIIDAPDVIAEYVAPSLRVAHLVPKLLQLLDVISGVIWMWEVGCPEEAIAAAKIDHRGQ